MYYRTKALSNPIRGFLILLAAIALQLSVPSPKASCFSVFSKETRLRAPVKVVHSVIAIMASAKSELGEYQKTAETLLKQTEEVVKTWKIVKVESKKDNAEKSIQWPVKGKITSKYGMRIHPVTGDKSFHNGIDIRGKKGTKVLAPTDAVVISTGWVGALGRMVKVKTQSGHILCFAHLSKIRCKKGEKLKKGQLLGNIGATGRATGPHLHFSVSYGGKYINPVNYLNK